mgnify:CR=1 FL=1
MSFMTLSTHNYFIYTLAKLNVFSDDYKYIYPIILKNLNDSYLDTNFKSYVSDPLILYTLTYLVIHFGSTNAF